MATEQKSLTSKTLDWSDRIRRTSTKIESLAYLLENQQGDPDLDILHEGIGLILHNVGDEIRGAANEMADDAFERRKGKRQDPLDVDQL